MSLILNTFNLSFKNLVKRKFQKNLTLFDFFTKTLGYE